MLSFKRAIIFAVFFLTAFILLRRSHTSNDPEPFRKPPPPPPPPEGSRDGHVGASHDPSTTSYTDTTMKDQEVPAQKAIQDMSKMSLYDKLAYQFPYDVETKFPAYIWQTWKWTPASGEFDFRDQEASWTMQHPGFVHEVITDQVAVHLLRLLYASVPEVLEAYNALPQPVLKADFFRYLILLARGGIYSDIDTFVIRSALEWIPDSVPKESIGLVIGIEADPDRPDWKDWYSRRIQFCQWTIQAKPGHPVLRDIVSRITKETLKRKQEGLFVSKDKSVVEFTGPAVWTDSIFDYFNDARYFDMKSSQGNISYLNFTGIVSPKKVGDVVVLPITSFSPGVQQMGAKDYDDPMAFVKHDFEVSQSPEPVGPLPNSPKLETTTLTYEELDSQSNTVAHSLRSLGVKKGDRVAVSLGNVTEHVVSTYAVFKLGAILVPFNPTFNAHQLSAGLSKLGVEVLIIGAVTDLAYKPCRGRSNLDLLTALVPNLTGGKIESPTVPSLKNIVLVDNTLSHPLAAFPPLQDLRALTPYAALRLSSSSRPVVPDAPLSAAETINIQFTSGTTSMPKAAMLSHASVLNNAHLVARRMGLVPDDRVVCPPPLFHCFGCVIGLGATAATGAATLFPSPAFDPAAALRVAAEHRATGLHGVPTMFAAELELLLAADGALAASLPRGGLAGLHKGVAAGSSVPEPLLRRVNDALGLRDLVVCYGMTETAPVSVMTAPADPPAARARTVGRAMPHTAVKVVSPADRARVVPRGERGELAVAGYLVMQGYYGEPERTAEDLLYVEDEDGIVGAEGGKDGKGGRLWMYSGDEACMDEHGYVEITGRIKDLIIRGGENIHPLEVEVALGRHRRVREASVVGVPDPRYGEVVGAFVAPHDGVPTVDDDGDGAGVTAGGGGQAPLTKQELRDWVRKHLSGHLAPKYVFWMHEFPKTASGKIQKFKLRELAKELVAKGAVDDLPK
ncbi:hypothetical protein GGR52DRAFT_580533 [Hypoxylon sp. FL1284]|nr:hypothetical protein GGR52DRAFT_580533 [Hypoxylon sp. FL1284]